MRTQTTFPTITYAFFEIKMFEKMKLIPYVFKLLNVSYLNIAFFFIASLIIYSMIVAITMLVQIVEPVSSVITLVATNVAITEKVINTISRYY